MLIGSWSWILHSAVIHRMARHVRMQWLKSTKMMRHHSLIRGVHCPYDWSACAKHARK